MKNEFILKTLLSHVAKGDYASFFVSCLTYNMPRSIVLWDIFLPNKEDREEVVSEVFCILWKEGKN